MLAVGNFQRRDAAMKEATPRRATREKAASFEPKPASLSKSQTKFISAVYQRCLREDSLSSHSSALTRARAAIATSYACVDVIEYLELAWALFRFYYITIRPYLLLRLVSEPE